MTRLESETCIIFNDAESTATITTPSPKTIRLLAKRGHGQGQPLASNSPYRRFTLPKRLVTIRGFSQKPHRTLSEEHKARLANSRRRRNPVPFSTEENSEKRD